MLYELLLCPISMYFHTLFTSLLSPLLQLATPSSNVRIFGRYTIDAILSEEFRDGKMKGKELFICSSVNRDHYLRECHAVERAEGTHTFSTEIMGFEPGIHSFEMSLMIKQGLSSQSQLLSLSPLTSFLEAEMIPFNTALGEFIVEDESCDGA